MMNDDDDIALLLFLLLLFIYTLYFVKRICMLCNRTVLCEQIIALY